MNTDTVSHLSGSQCSNESQKITKSLHQTHAQKTVLVVTDNLADQINGVVTTFKNLEAHAVLDGYSILYLDPGQFLHVGCPGYSEIKLSVPWQIGKKIEAMAPDHIHIATEGPIGLFARFYLDQRSVGYNTSYHTKFPEAVKQIFGIPESLSWRYMRWFHKHSGRVLTTTDSMVQDLRCHGFDGDIRSWTRGVDRELFKPRLSRKINHSRSTLLCVSRISKEKSLEDFCKIKLPNTHKVLVGDGPDRKRLQSLYPDVEFVGTRTGADLVEFYREADVFVFPSRWDTFGIVMIEAMACGTPVAAYPVQGPLDVIDAGVTGCMNQDLAQAVTDALSLPRDNVYQHSLKWSWQSAWNIFRDNLI